MDTRQLLRDMFDAAVAAAQPACCVPPFLQQLPPGRLLVIGAGKASAEMAQVVEQHWDGPLQGLVVTAYGHATACKHIEIVEAAHPVPDAAGEQAARRIMALVQDLTPEDTVLCLISGGGSALLPLPLPGITLEHKQQLARALLQSGASISEINTVRRHLSAIKGGRLAAQCHPARRLTLLISDVPGDQLADIASGPTVGDATTCADALEILQRYDIEMPDAVRQLLDSGAGESVKPDDARLQGSTAQLVATPQLALQAAARVAEAAGVTPYILGDSIEGESREVGKVLAGLTQQVLLHGQPFQPPCVLLSGGETTVTVRGQGRGGRNVEYLLSLGLSLRGAARVWALAADTDGVDGLEPIAGAILTPDTLERAWAQGLSPVQSLQDNDGHGFFGALDDAVITGPTRTNVNDFRAILILPE
ncbi:MULTISPECIES: glycerate kinase type-2 family protein [Brachymonas]|uniref:glycerate kinase type-2 family protein n=1 Tax=Brachymonas TaxID=28219 RepID=UPI002E7601E8|nr:glycerate kinase [Brachymonas sp. J145]MEE1654024.1 glycerate kinase [Brachymonas sp. J145]